MLGGFLPSRRCQRSSQRIFAAEGVSACADRPRRGRPRGTGRKAQRLQTEADADTAEILAAMAGMPASGFIAPARGGGAAAAPTLNQAPEQRSGQALPNGGDPAGGHWGGDPVPKALDPSDPRSARAWQPPGAPEMVFWLGLVSAVGALVHGMLAVPRQPRGPPAVGLDCAQAAANGLHPGPTACSGAAEGAPAAE